MPIITAFILAAFAGYGVSMYFGMIEGNFALVLFMAAVVSGVYWIAEKLYFLPRRQQAAALLLAQETQRQSDLTRMGIQFEPLDVNPAQQKVLVQPWWLDWTAGLFPVILAVFLLRSFLFEPFKIPSGSMIPTLQIGDLILVNKFRYGVRLPIINTKITEGRPVQRGDVIVFKYPPNPNLDYIKRVVGLPGDQVAYLNKRLTINGQPVVQDPLPDYLDDDTLRYFKHFEERLPTQGGQRMHRLLQDEARPAFILGASDFAGKNQCQYSVEGVTCTVPAGHYFMMGDNRDNSLDSRYWGFVPDENIVGKAFFVWMNFSNPARIGAFD